jgi:hypothetical protein
MSGYATPHSAASSSTSLPSTASKVPSKSKPVNVFSNDGSFLERFQRSTQVSNPTHLPVLFFFTFSRAGRRRQTESRSGAHKVGLLSLIVLGAETAFFCCVFSKKQFADRFVRQSFGQPDLPIHPRHTHTEKPGQASTST